MFINAINCVSSMKSVNVKRGVNSNQKDRVVPQEGNLSQDTVFKPGFNPKANGMIFSNEEYGYLD